MMYSIDFLVIPTYYRLKFEMNHLKDENNRCIQPQKVIAGMGLTWVRLCQPVRIITKSQ